MVRAHPETAPPPRAGHIVEYGTLGRLCAYPPIVDKVQQLMAAYGNCRPSTRHQPRSAEPPTSLSVVTPRRALLPLTLTATSINRLQHTARATLAPTTESATCQRRVRQHPRRSVTGLLRSSTH